MKIVKNIVISKKILLERKLRTALSLSGIIIGVCVVIVMVALGNGTGATVTAQITKMGSNLLLVNAGQVKIIAGRVRQTRTVTTLELKDADSIAEEVQGVKSVAPAQIKKLKVKYGDLSTNTNIIGTTADIVTIQNHSLLKGRFFDEDENKGLRRVAVIGKTVADNIFGQQDPTGETIYIGRIPFEVIGVFSPKGLDFYGTDQDDQIFIPVKTALRRLFNLTYINTIYVKVKNQDTMDETAKEVNGLLREKHHLRKGKENDFTVMNQTAILEAQKESGRTFTFLIASIAALSLLVGGIGILAVMLIWYTKGRRRQKKRHPYSVSIRSIAAKHWRRANRYYFRSRYINCYSGIYQPAAYYTCRRYRNNFFDYFYYRRILWRIPGNKGISFGSH
jgi:putative ABC transport system permease protein